jgi:hypothetical protein
LYGRDWLQLQLEHRLVYRHGRPLLEHYVLYHLQQQCPVFLVIKQLHRHAHALLRSHFQHMLRKPRVQLLFLRVLYGHAYALLDSHYLNHV